MYDGEYEIIFSQAFNIHENKLRLTDIKGWDVELIFNRDPSKEKAPIVVSGDGTKKKVILTLTNFYNGLGLGTAEKMPIVEFDDNGSGDKKKLFFSIYASSIGDTINFLNVTITFYLK